ncbi:MAG: hypothetical protein WA804_15125 [Terriglobales bacterium]
MLLDQLKPNIIVRGPIFPEPVQVIVAIPMGTSVKLVGKGLNTNQVHEPILSAEQLAQLVSTPEKEPFDGDPLRFRLGIEALRLGLAYEYDPYFSLSIARVDPLPHQLEAVYDYFLTMPRIRFLLADDPGAGNPRPNCKDSAPAQRWCEFKRTQLHVGGDNTPYDQWNLIVQAAGPVKTVTCTITGTNQFEYMAAFGGPKRNPFPGDIYGDVAICRGWINGGEAPVTVTVTY